LILTQMSDKKMKEKEKKERKDIGLLVIN
jgi:hypothetical protein